MRKTPTLMDVLLERAEPATPRHKVLVMGIEIAVVVGLLIWWVL